MNRATRGSRAESVFSGVSCRQWNLDPWPSIVPQSSGIAFSWPTYSTERSEGGFQGDGGNPRAAQGGYRRPALSADRLLGIPASALNRSPVTDLVLPHYVAPMCIRGANPLIHRNL